MKLHLPLKLRRVLLAFYASSIGITLSASSASFGEDQEDIYLDNVNGTMTLVAVNLIDITNGDELNAGSSLTSTHLAIHGADALTATDTSFSISTSTTIDQNGSLKLVVNTGKTTDFFGSLVLDRGAFSAQGVAGTEFAASGISVGDGSTLTLDTIKLTGDISTQADTQRDIVTLTGAAVVGNVTINNGDVINMTSSSVSGTVQIDNSSLNLKAGGNSTIGALVLSNNAKISIEKDSSLISSSGDVVSNGAMDININGSLISSGEIVSNGTLMLSSGSSLTGSSIAIHGTSNADNKIIGGGVTATSGNILIDHAQITTGVMTAAGNIDITGNISGFWNDGGLTLTSQQGSIDWKVTYSLVSTMNTVMDAAQDIFLNVAMTDTGASLKAGGTLFVNANTSLGQAEIFVEKTNIASGASLALGENSPRGSNSYSLGDVTNLGTLNIGNSSSPDMSASAESLANSGTLQVEGYHSLNVSNDITTLGTAASTAIVGTLTGVNITLVAGTGLSNVLTGGAVAASGNLSITDAVMGNTKLSGDTVTLNGTFGTTTGNTVTANKLVVNTDIVWNDSNITLSAMDIAKGKSVGISGYYKNFAQLGEVTNAGSLTIGANKATTVFAASVTNTGDFSMETEGSSLTVSGSIISTGDGSMNLVGSVNVADETIISGDASLSLDSITASDLGDVTVNDNGELTLAGKSINADNITLNDVATGTISDVIINLGGGKGEIILNDGSRLDISDSVINGSITTTNTSSTNSTHLGLDNVDITGDLTVAGGDLVLSDNNTVSGSLNISDTVNVTVNNVTGTPGTLVVKDGTTIAPNASLIIDSESNFTSNVTMTGGDFTINGNAGGNNFNGSIVFNPNDNQAYPDALASVVTINGTHNQNVGITVNADASINVNGALNINGPLSSGANGGDTLTLNGNGEAGDVVINSSNQGFADDISIGGGTLVLNANEGIGKEGTLSITGENVTMQNTVNGATISKEIATNGNGLTIQTDGNLILAGHLDASNDTIVKAGNADLHLSHDPLLNDANSFIGTLTQNAGNVLMDGTGYVVGSLNIADGDLNFTSMGGNTVHNLTAGEGATILLNGSNPAANGVQADILGNLEDNDGIVRLAGAALETDGTQLGLAELHISTSANGMGSSSTLVNSIGTVTSITIDVDSELTLDGSSIQGDELVNSGHTTIKDTELTLDGALYVQDGGILNIDGASSIDSDIVLSDGSINILEGSSSLITAESTLEFNVDHVRANGELFVNVHENFTMDGDILMNSEGNIMVDEGKIMDVNGEFAGMGDLNKMGQGTLAFNTVNTDYVGTLHLVEGTLAATASNAYGSASILSIQGDGVNILTGTQNGSPVIFDSGMTVDGDYDFTVNTLSNTTWSGQLVGVEGSMTKMGNSTLALTNAENRDFKTAVNVAEGGLALNGNIGSDVSLAKGTMLSGNGSTSGRVLAMADDTIIEIGEAEKALTASHGGVETLTFGSVVFESSEADDRGVYKTGTKTIVDLDLANNASDKLVVEGTAYLNNSLIEIRKDVYSTTQERTVTDGTRFHIVEAGELSGTFNGEVQHDLYLLNAHLENTATGTDLVLSVNYKGIEEVQTPNSISSVIEGIENDGIATGELLDMIDAFKHTKSEAEAKAALESVGGMRISTMMSSMLAGNISHLRNLRGSMGTGTSTTTLTSDGKGDLINKERSVTEVWVTPTMAYNKVNGDRNSPGFSRSAWGAMMGAERSINPSTMFGLSLGYDSARTEVMGAIDESDTYNIDIYGIYRDGNWQNRVSLGVGFHDLDADRFVTVGDRFARMSRGSATGTSLNFSYELSYAFQLDNKSSIAPLFSMESSMGWIDSYSEEGDIGNAGLHVGSQDAWSTILGLGGRYTRNFTMISDAPSARFEAMALMTVDVGDQGAEVSASFLGAPGREFIINPASQNRIGAMVGASLTVPFSGSLSGFGGSTFEIRNGTRDVTANIGLRYSF